MHWSVLRTVPRCVLNGCFPVAPEAAEGNKKCNNFKTMTRCNVGIDESAPRALGHFYSKFALQCLKASAEQAQKQEQINATHPLQFKFARAMHLSIEMRMLSRHVRGLWACAPLLGCCVTSVILYLLHFFLPSLAAVHQIFCPPFCVDLPNQNGGPL